MNETRIAILIAALISSGGSVAFARTPAERHPITLNRAAFDYARELIAHGRLVADKKGSWRKHHPFTLGGKTNLSTTTAFKNTRNGILGSTADTAKKPKSITNSRLAISQHSTVLACSRSKLARISMATPRSKLLRISY